MRIKLKYPDVETFIQKYAVNISRGGIFIATKQPKAVGTNLRFEFLLASGEAGLSIIRGEGQVLWTREFDPDQPTKAHGMGVRFTKLDPESQAVVDRALAWRTQQSGGVERKETSSATPLPAMPTPTPAPAPAPPEPPPTEPIATRAAAAESTKPIPVALAAGGETQPQTLPPLTSGRAPDEATKPIALPEGGDARPLPREPTTTIPTLIPEMRHEPRFRLSVERDPSREIRIRGALPDDLDSLAREWGISDEQIDRVLKRARPRMVEATAELERLLRKPPRGTPPSKAEALKGLRELLDRGSPVLEITVDRKRAR